jgi:hypothetical protein
MPRSSAVLESALLGRPADCKTREAIPSFSPGQASVRVAQIGSIAEGLNLAFRAFGPRHKSR